MVLVIVALLLVFYCLFGSLGGLLEFLFVFCYLVFCGLFVVCYCCGYDSL